jgi:hypothetical protein
MRHFDEYIDIDHEALLRAKAILRSNEDEAWALDQLVRCRTCNGRGCSECSFIGAIHWQNEGEV